MTNEKCDKLKQLKCSYPHCSCLTQKFDGREPSEKDLMDAVYQYRGNMEKARGQKL